MENAREYVSSLFFDGRRYNLGRVGRYKINRRLGLDIPESQRLLSLEDLLAILKGLFSSRDGRRRHDDIDHLGNRRVRAVGELLLNQIRIGLLRMERIAKERMTTIPDLSAATARELVNVRPISAALREFFGSGQLSQFMDQTNPLGGDYPSAASLRSGSRGVEPGTGWFRSPGRALYPLWSGLPH